MVVAFFVAEKEEARRRELRQEQRVELKAEQGTACPPLLRAADDTASGDERGIRESILEAERLALRALDTSGIAFGKPERLALFLAEDMRAELRGERSRDASGRLEDAVEKCKHLKAS